MSASWDIYDHFDQNSNSASSAYFLCFPEFMSIIIHCGTQYRTKCDTFDPELGGLLVCHDAIAVEGVPLH